MLNETCKHHEAINKELERYAKHCDESDKQGGYRDRLVTAEVNIIGIRSGVYKAAIVGGLIGALSGQAMPELMNFIVKKLFGA
jgi:hypothetical protein